MNHRIKIQARVKYRWSEVWANDKVNSGDSRVVLRVHSGRAATQNRENKAPRGNDDDSNIKNPEVIHTTHGLFTFAGVAAKIDTKLY